jgi:hypothetical protein
MNDVEPRLYASVLREMIRHENDVTNHRIMWLLIGQGLIANAYVGAVREHPEIVLILAPMGILVTLSAFVILYKSYQARGYLQHLGNAAKAGTLCEEFLPLSGWPQKRLRDWRKQTWFCPWLGQVPDLLEPYFTLPSLLVLAWLFVLLEHVLTLGTGMLLLLSTLLVAAILSGMCFFWVLVESRNEAAA